MKATKIIVAVCIAAMFFSLPIMSADGSDTEAAKSWVDGESAAYYKATDINDVETAGKLYGLSSLASLCRNVGEVEYKSYDVTKVTDLSIERGSTEKVADSKKLTGTYQKIEGKVEFTAEMSNDGKFVSESTDEYITGDMYVKINEYFGDLKKGDTVKYSSDIKYITSYKSETSYTEIATAYAMTANTTEYRSYMYNELKITIGDKTVSVVAKTDMYEYDTTSYKFDSELTKESAVPTNAKKTLTIDVRTYDAECYAIIDGEKYSLGFDKDKYTEDAKKKECTDKEEKYYWQTYSIKADVGYKAVTNGFSSNDDAEKYIADKGIEHGVDYSKVNDNINSTMSYTPSSSSSDSSSSSGNDNTTLYIIIGVIAAIIVIVLIAVVIIKKRK